VHLGVDLSAVTTKASMGDAFRVALARIGSHMASGGPGASSVPRNGTTTAPL
jgi:hypothetical protein